MTDGSPRLASKASFIERGYKVPTDGEQNIRLATYEHKRHPDVPQYMTTSEYSFPSLLPLLSPPDPRDPPQDNIPKLSQDALLPRSTFAVLWVNAAE